MNRQSSHVTKAIVAARASIYLQTIRIQTLNPSSVFDYTYMATIGNLQVRTT
jgi:hypothetical protein